MTGKDAVCVNFSRRNLPRKKTRYPLTKEKMYCIIIPIMKGCEEAKYAQTPQTESRRKVKDGAAECRNSLPSLTAETGNRVCFGD